MSGNYYFPELRVRGRRTEQHNIFALSVRLYRVPGCYDIHIYTGYYYYCFNIKTARIVIYGSFAQYYLNFSIIIEICDSNIKTTTQTLRLNIILYYFA